MAFRSKCKSLIGIDDKIRCMLDEKLLEVYDVSGDYDTSHKFGVHQVYHAMVMVGDDMFEMNAHALMPNGINMWAGEVAEWERFMERKKDKQTNDITLMPEQMKKAILERYEEKGLGD